MKGLVLVGQSVLTDKEYLGITVPFMLSTMTQPLMGAVNTALMGSFPIRNILRLWLLGQFSSITFIGFLGFSGSVLPVMLLRL